MDAADWDARYAESELVWSRGPNRLVAAECADLPPGRAVDLACGEGRNALWLASRGWHVTAVDFSQVALDKGRRLAEGEDDAAVDWVCADATQWRGEGYDLAVVAYFQVPARRSAYGGAPRRRRRCGPAAPCCGWATTATNLTEGTGGPQDPRVLMTAEDVLADLDGIAGGRRARGAGGAGRQRRRRARRRGGADRVGLSPAAPPGMTPRLRADLRPTAPGSAGPPTARGARPACGPARRSRRRARVTASRSIRARPTSGRYVAPATPSSATGSGTTATPSPAATKVTSVEVSATSCRTIGSKPACAAQAHDGVVHGGAAPARVHDQALVAQVRDPDRACAPARR